MSEDMAGEDPSVPPVANWRHLPNHLRKCPAKATKVHALLGSLGNHGRGSGKLHHCFGANRSRQAATSPPWLLRAVSRPRSTRRLRVLLFEPSRFLSRRPHTSHGCGAGVFRFGTWFV